MPLIDTPKAKELLNYWEDCQRLRDWLDDPRSVDSFFDELIPARLREATTPFGVMLNLRLRALDQRRTSRTGPGQAS